MTITQVNTPLAVYDTNDAGFRLWGKAWTDTMDALGLTQEHSSIDWTTATMPTSAAAWAGKRVYKFGDSLSGTREVYVALYFGRGSTTYPFVGFALRIRVGYTHSEGVVSGVPIDHYITTQATSSETGEIIGVRTDLGLSLFMNVPWTSNNCQPGFMVERLAKDGAASPDGAVMLFHGASVDGVGSYSALIYGQAANYKGGTTHTTQSFSTLANMPSMIPTNVDASYEDSVPVWPITTLGAYDPVSGMVIPPQMYGASTVFSATMNGEARKYRTLYGAGYWDSSSRLRWAHRVPV